MIPPETRFPPIRGTASGYETKCHRHEMCTTEGVRARMQNTSLLPLPGTAGTREAGVHVTALSIVSHRLDDADSPFAVPSPTVHKLCPNG
jgi:hypothetical protein